LERPSQWAEKEILTGEDGAEFQRQILQRANADRRDGGATADVDRAYNEAWFDRGSVQSTIRTSLIVDPQNGRMPPLTPQASAKQTALAEARRRRGPADSYEDRPLTERCLLNHGVPPLPTGYNNNYQILQARGYVAILYEMLDEVRVVRLGPESSGGDEHVRQWKGNSRGHWEGNTLVVDTGDFNDQVLIRGINVKPSDALHVVERLTRTDAQTIDYRATIDDPKTWVRPWTVAVPLKKTEELMYEYACHEGNYAMSGILSGARAQEKAAARRIQEPN
jgi:hypothetical protein